MTDRVKGAVAVRRLRAAARTLPPGRLLLAISGGRDSMVLLHVAAAVRANRDDLVVATFDHGTGPAATRAVELVERTAARLGLACITGAGRDIATNEDALRRARWAFLNAWATDLDARVVTAHTRDDQVETVFIRILRDAGARGLAAMYAPSTIVRPLLDIGRDDIAAYAAAGRVKWVEDPSNAGLAFLRNRVRHELLPAILRRRPRFARDLLVLARRAARLREEVSRLVTEIAGWEPGVIPAEAIVALTPAGAAVVWPELASRVGVSLDWRGIARLVSEAPNLKVGKEIPLSGGVTVRRTVSSFLIRAVRPPAPLY